MPRAWHHPYPRFYWPDGSETLAGEILRLCAREEGMPTPWGGGTYTCEFDGTRQQNYGGWKILRRRSTIHRLASLDLIVELRTGPRNGKYWHTTEKGDVFCALIAQGPQVYRTALMLAYL